MSTALDIEKSLMQARWVMPDAALSDIEQLARKHDLPEIVARLLCARGIDADKVQNFLYPTLRNDFPDPFLLQGMAQAAGYLAQAIIDKRFYCNFR